MASEVATMRPDHDLEPELPRFRAPWRSASVRPPVLSSLMFTAS